MNNKNILLHRAIPFVVKFVVAVVTWSIYARTLLENHSVSTSYPFQPLDINDIGQTNYPNKCENVTRSIRIHGTKITPAAVAAAVAK